MSMQKIKAGGLGLNTKHCWPQQLLRLVLNNHLWLTMLWIMVDVMVCCLMTCLCCVLSKYCTKYVVIIILLCNAMWDLCFPSLYQTKSNGRTHNLKIKLRHDEWYSANFHVLSFTKLSGPLAPHLQIKDAPVAEKLLTNPPHVAPQQFTLRATMLGCL